MSPSRSPWWDGLSSETIRQLRVRYPTLSLDQIAVEAMRHPACADEFTRLRAKVVEYDPAWASPDSGVVGSGLARPEDYPRPRVPEKAAAAFRDLVVAVMLGDADAKGEPGGKGRVREPGPVPISAVSACESLLRQRSAVKRRGERPPHELTLEGIGQSEDVGFNRERVRQIELLLRLGWPLQKRHPDFSASDGYVRLPSVDKAAAALGLSDAEKASRLAEKLLPLT